MVNVGTGGIGTKIINKNYPVEEGLTAGTQKQKGRQINLVPQESSTVLSTDNFGIE